MARDELSSPLPPEMAEKVVDGCAVNGRFWVFAGGATDVGVKLTVHDSVAVARRS